MGMNVFFTNGKLYSLVEYFDAENEFGNGESGIEVWEGTEFRYLVPGASFLDDSDPDAEEYNLKEMQFIQQEGFDNGWIS